MRYNIVDVDEQRAAMKKVEQANRNVEDCWESAADEQQVPYFQVPEWRNWQTR